MRECFRINPQTKEITHSFQSMRKAAEQFNLSQKTLRRYANTKKLLDGALWGISQLIPANTCVECLQDGFEDKDFHAKAGYRVRMCKPCARLKIREYKLRGKLK